MGNEWERRWFNLVLLELVYVALTELASSAFLSVPWLSKFSQSLLFYSSNIFRINQVSLVITSSLSQLIIWHFHYWRPLYNDSFIHMNTISKYSRIPQKELSQLDLRLVLFYIIVEPCVCAIGSSSYFVILFFDDDICLSIECKKNKKVLKVNIHPNDRSMVCHWILTCLCETKG